MTFVAGAPSDLIEHGYAFGSKYPRNDIFASTYLSIAARTIYLTMVVSCVRLSCFFFYFMIMTGTLPVVGGGLLPIFLLCSSLSSAP